MHLMVLTKCCKNIAQCQDCWIDEALPLERCLCS